MLVCGLLLSLGLKAPVLARCAQPANHVFNIRDYGARKDFPGTGTFLEESPPEKAQLHFSGDFLGDAKIPVQADLQHK
jgi:hypothetical protein